MKVNCDNCNEDFEIKAKTKMKRIEGENIEIAKFKCPECGEQYQSVLGNQKIKEMNNKVKSLIERGKDLTLTIDERDKIVKEIRGLRSKIRKEHNRIKELVG
ncbi:YgiT-type zinc finger protein [Natroniella acetigena]|uniref:YgiT-type zinc finger protein n=1 Tax=Natroniella acetigena TaxID=52004 RepID=UPI00200B6542|nr:YgiT-type zinc finger protein [Natroniella acetigena]MCK8826411.1 YgiT-type zinc finger protein [Natroniella acetigena]